ncbi:hypothetical protein ABKY54_004521 [Vibrio harveyi]
MKTLILSLFLVSFAASAAGVDNDKEINLLAGGWSQHFFKQPGPALNYKNDLLAVEYDNWIVGTFKNSYDDRTYTAAYDFNWQRDDLEYGVAVGLNYGYCGSNQKDKFIDKYGCDTANIVPMVMPYVSYSKFRIKPTVGLLWNALILTFKIEL